MGSATPRHVRSSQIRDGTRVSCLAGGLFAAEPPGRSQHLEFGRVGGLHNRPGFQSFRAGLRPHVFPVGLAFSWEQGGTPQSVKALKLPTLRIRGPHVDRLFLVQPCLVMACLDCQNWCPERMESQSTTLWASFSRSPARHLIQDCALRSKCLDSGQKS